MRALPGDEMAKRPIIIIVMGVSGSGKTTIGQLLARDLGWTFHDADLDHPPSNIAKMSRGEPLSEADRQPWLETLANRIKKWLASNQNAVLACSALTESARAVLRAGDDRVHFVHLKSPLHVIEPRIRNRADHFMSAALLESQYRTLQEPQDAITIDANANPDWILQEVRRKMRI